jgi:hypothetical protein
MLKVNAVNLGMESLHQKMNQTKEALENARLIQALQLTYTQRFYALTKLIRISTMISNAKIIRSPKMQET